MWGSRKALAAIALACSGGMTAGAAHAAPHAVDVLEFAAQALSPDARYMARWVVHSGDNQGRPFAVVDKKGAKLFLFDAQGRLAASSPALLGMARGDHSVPGVGQLAPSRIPVAARTTPAGRFKTEPGRNTDGDDVIWFDYDAGLAIHRLRPGAAYDARKQRLAAGQPDAQRVSAGCVVVPGEFFDTAVRSMFGKRAGWVYVLPEMRSVREMFSERSADM